MSLLSCSIWNGCNLDGLFKPSCQCLRRCFRVLQAKGMRNAAECGQTFGQVSVPHARAATAWAPPAFRTWVTPAFLAQYSTSGVTCSPTVTCEPFL